MAEIPSLFRSRCRENRFRFNGRSAGAWKEADGAIAYRGYSRSHFLCRYNNGYAVPKMISLLTASSSDRLTITTMMTKETRDTIQSKRNMSFRNLDYKPHLHSKDLIVISFPHEIVLDQ